MTSPPHLTGAERPTLVAQVGHSDTIKSLAFSPAGPYVLTASLDRSLELWDATTGRVIMTLLGHEHSVMTASFSSDGKSIVTGSTDYTARLWETATGRESQRFVGHKHWVTAAVLSRDGRRLLTGSHDRTARLWDVATHQELKKFEGFGHYVEAVAFSPDGELCAAGSLDKTIRVYKTATGEPLGEPLRAASGISRLMFLPGGDQLVSAEETDGILRLWDVRAGRELRIFAGEHKSSDPERSLDSVVIALGFLPETQTLVSASAERVVFWRFADAQPLRHLELLGKDITAVAVSADAREVLTGANDGTTVLLDADGGRELQRFEGKALRVARVSASADGHFVLVGGKGRVAVLWDTEQGREVRRFTQEGGVACPRLSPDGAWLFTSDDEGVGRTLSATDGRELQRYVGHQGDINSVVFSADGERILTGGIDGTARLWNRRTGAQLKQFGTQTGIINAVAFSPDEKHVLTGGDNSPIRMWGVESERQEAQFDGPDPRLSVEAVAFMPDGKSVVAAGGVDTAIRLWDIETRAVKQTFNGHTERVSSLAVSRDGRHLLSGSWDRTVRLWDVQSGEQRPFGPHAGWGAEAVFFRGERYVLAATADGMTRLWDVEAPEASAEFCSLISFEGGAWVVADPEGRFDTNDIEQARQLSWVMSDDLMTPLPVEIFMRQYFEPRLLSRLLDHDDFGEVPELAGLNRAQPVVRVAGARRDDDGTAVVTVEVEAGHRQFERNGRPVVVASGAKDLRLFRNGRLVGYSDGDLLGGGPPGEGVRCEPVEGRRDACRAVFKGIALPRGVPSSEVEFYAYAFNSSDVKSETHRRGLDPSPAGRSGARRAYLISVGVAGYENSDWNLHFAADDSRLFAAQVGARLRATNEFEEVVEVLLTADAGERPAADPRTLATKDNFRRVLSTLAHGGDSGFAGLRKATPDDVVIVFYSSHGFRDLEHFYLFPYNIGAGHGRDPAAVIPHAVTDADLYLWLRDVDAGELVLIIDACHAEASVAPGGRLKPGPMGSSGLGQLAYDKGMRVLAATQAETTAQEADIIGRRLRIQSGLLTHALIVDGLIGKLADEDGDGTILLSEWLNYVLKDVPALHSRVLQSKTEDSGAPAGAGAPAPGDSGEAVSLQYPALFDFTAKVRGQRPLMIQKAGR